MSAAVSSSFEHIQLSESTSYSLTDLKNIDHDASQLAAMGYAQDMRRNFSLWSILGVGFSLTNSWFAISVALVTGINSGGPVLLIYGILGIFFISVCVGVSLSELASALPSAGGQYFWANELASKKYANFASYLTGWIAWAGAIFTSAAVAVAVAQAIVGCWQLTHPGFQIQPWHIFVSYELVNVFAALFNCCANILPVVVTCALYTSLISFAVILITVPAKAPTHETARFVFASFVNTTGWRQSGIAFIVGLINTNWAFACLDCATHMAEEVPRPERIIPLAIMGTIGIGFVTSWFFSISMMFSLSSLEAVTDTATGVPILELFYQAVGTRAGAVVLESLVAATGILCLVSSQTWQSRLCWSFARDRGVPGHHLLSRVHAKLDVPLYAHFISCCLVAAVGCLYLGSTAAFNSMVSASIVLLYVSYSIPVICLLLRGRDTIRHGPFWFRRFGLFSNIVLLSWTLFTIVMYSFPAQTPAKAGNMNYVSAVYGVLAVIIAADWSLRARRSFRGQSIRHDEASHATHVARYPADIQGISV